MYRILTQLGSDVDRFYKDPTQDNLDKLTSSVDLLDSGNESLKNSIFTLIKGITDEDNNVIDGREHETGIEM